MNLKSLVFTSTQIKTMNKFLKSLSVGSLENAGLTPVEQDEFWTVYSAFDISNSIINQTEREAVDNNDKTLSKEDKEALHYEL